ncbi:MAG: hypothetical protein ABW065_05820 [Solirubrobacterales bacterium]
MNEAAIRAGAIGVLGSRVAYGLALVISPSKVAGNRWLGDGAREPAAQVPLRGVGAREIALHGVALGALLRDAPLRPLLAASIAGDLADIAATTISREGLPDGSAKATAAVAGGSLLITLALAALLDD